MNRIIYIDLGAFPSTEYLDGLSLLKLVHTLLKIKPDLVDLNPTAEANTVVMKAVIEEDAAVMVWTYGPTNILRSCGAGQLIYSHCSGQTGDGQT